MRLPWGERPDPADEVRAAHARGLATSLANIEAFAREQGISPEEKAECERAVLADLQHWLDYRLWKIKHDEGRT